ncbi:MAG: transposase, partial [Bacillota bacterium]
PSKWEVDAATLQAVIAHRYDVLQRYARSMKQASAAEIAELRSRGFLKDSKAAKSLKKWLHLDAADVPAEHRATLDEALASSAFLKTTWSMRQELSRLWERSTLSTEQLVSQLKDWCERAEKSGVGPLAEFSRRLRCYV